MSLHLNTSCYLIRYDIRYATYIRAVFNDLSVVYLSVISNDIRDATYIRAVYNDINDLTCLVNNLS